MSLMIIIIIIISSDVVPICHNFVIYITVLYYLFIHYLQLGRHPVAGVITCYISMDYEDFPLKFR